jgi:stage II sporulation protein D
MSRRRWLAPACALAVAGAAWLPLGAPLPALAASPALRVGVLEGATSILVASSLPAALVDDRGTVVTRLAALEGWTATAEGARVTLRGPGGKAATIAGALRIQATAAGVPLVFAGKRWYRGMLELRPGRGGGVTAVNLVDLEHYLYGVVPSEMSASWPASALMSQAVAARSYAMASVRKHASRGYDVCDTDECQVYTGAAAESAASNRAVDATRGVVLTKKGKVLAAYFHSSSGGYTENSEDVWIQKLPHIRAVPDYDQNSPHYTWYKNVPAATIESKLASRGVRVGALRALNPVSRSYSGRVREIQVVGAAGSKTISGETLRLAAGLNSTLFNLAPRGGSEGSPAEFAFAGRGWGHGLGLSQWGARRLAEAGYGYQQILAHYYPGSALRKY